MSPSEFIPLAVWLQIKVLRCVFFRLFDCVYEALFNGKCVSIHIKYTGSVHRSFVTTYKERFVCFVFLL